MIRVKAVTYSDVIVLNFLKDKAPDGTAIPLRNAEIMAQTGIPECTIRRALSRLHSAGLISRSRSLGETYTYKVNDGNNSAIA